MRKPIRAEKSPTLSPPCAPDLHVVVLAAGQGKRLLSATPKVLHRANGRALIDHVLAAARELAPVRLVIVVGHGREEVEAHLRGTGDPAGHGLEARPPDLTFVAQEPQLGTGHAVRMALPHLPPDGILLVLSGDVPLLTAASMRALLQSHRDRRAAASFLTARLDDPGAYGRVCRDGAGAVTRIVEARDATAEELAISEVNTGTYAFALGELSSELAALGRDNAQREEYLTDVVARLTAAGKPVAGIPLANPEDMLGVNSRSDLACVEGAMRARKAAALMDGGVTCIDPRATYVEWGVEVGRDTILLPGTSLRGTTRIGAGCTIGPYVTLIDCEIEDGAEVKMGCLLDGARVRRGAAIGPFAHLRPGTDIGEGAKVGNFVETKQVRLGKGSKASHLSYLGDADIGAGVNIGAGTITCNYDGEKKHLTVIEDGVFIGSDSQLVAPVTVRRGAYVGAGSTITHDVPEGALAVARARQVNHEGWATKKKARSKK